MRDEKGEEANIGKGVLQIRGENGLQRPADSPEVGDFQPALAPGEQRHQDSDHGPIAELKGKRSLPLQSGRDREINFVADIVEQEETREQSINDSVAPGPAAFPREGREDERQRNRERD